MGSCLQLNELIQLPQVWDYVFAPVGRPLKGNEGPKGPFRLFGYCIRCNYKTIFYNQLEPILLQ